MTNTDEQRIRILVLDRGFVMVCRCANPMNFGFWLRVYDARIIRQWGTSKGLGELCQGPKTSTQLDAIVGQESIPIRAIIRVLEVEQSKWEPSLKTASKRTRHSVD